MPKTRLIVPISLQFSVRYLLRTGLLERIRNFAEPVILLGWQDAELEAELGRDFEVHPLFKSRWGTRYEYARGYLNTWHQRRFASPSTPIRERRADLDRPFAARLRRRLRNVQRNLRTILPGSVESLRRSEVELFWKDTNASEVHRRIAALRADGVVCLTPFLHDEEMAVRVCALSGMPTAAAILSFDNLTTRSWIPAIFDQYILWNRHNASQLARGYPESAASDVAIAGSPQFDFYWNPRYIWDDAEWRRVLGLPPGRPVILFGGGFYTCAPHEPRFLAQLDDAISRGLIPERPIILFRRHPVDPIGRWEPVLNQCRHVVHDDPWRLGAKVLGHTNVRDDDIAKLASTLFHTQVHVNVASTMSVDGAIFDRPQIGPAYDDSPGGKYHRAAIECYLQEHYLPITHSGGMAIVRSQADLIAAVREGLLNPEKGKEGRERMVREICTYNDGRCTERVADTISAFMNRIVVSTSDAKAI